MVLLRSFIPPRATGAAKPTFKLLSNGAFDGVNNLNPSLTINGTTVTPTFRYKGGDADGTNWNQWTYGEILPVVSTGTAADLNQGSPLLSSNDDSLKFNAGWYYQDSGSSFADVTTEDLVFEMVVKYSVSDNTVIASKRAAGGEGWRLDKRTGPNIRVLIEDSAAHSIKWTSASIPAEAWYHVIVFVNRSENSTNGMQGYVNGISSGTGLNASSVLTMTSAGSMIIGAGNAGAAPLDANIAYLAMWKQSAWHQEGASGPTEWASIAKERFYRLIGIYPALAKGTAAPTLATRATIACLDKSEDSDTTRKIYCVGPGWLRCASRVDSTATLVKGYLAEQSATNLILQSEDLGTTWAPIDAGDTVGGSVVTPTKATSTTAGIIGDATDGPHGFSQAVTLTAVNYTFSCFAKKGDQDWLLIDNATIANGKVWFNLATGAKGTQQAGIVAASIHSCGDGWYFCHYAFLGTVAAHTLEVRPSEADNDTGFAGDGAAVNTYVWGSQCE